MARRLVREKSDWLGELALAMEKHGEEFNPRLHVGFDGDPPAAGKPQNRWTVYLYGPPDSPYEEGKFQLSVKFPSDYPFHPPSIKFMSKIFHPNISSDGEICVDILKTSAWVPSLTLVKVIHSLRSLLCDPNASDPLDTSAAHLYKQDVDHSSFNAKVRQYVKKYAHNPEFKTDDSAEAKKEGKAAAANGAVEGDEVVETVVVAEAGAGGGDIGGFSSDEEWG